MVLYSIFRPPYFCRCYSSDSHARANMHKKKKNSSLNWITRFSGLEDVGWMAVIVTVSCSK